MAADLNIAHAGPLVRFAVAVAILAGALAGAVPAHAASPRRTPDTPPNLALHSDRRLLSVTERLRHSGARPLSVRVTVTQPVNRLILSLNGHRVALSALRRGRSERIALGGDEGLRFGSNRLVIIATRYASGAFDRVVRNLRLSRHLPLVSAGPARTTMPGQAVSLDGRSSRAPTAGGLLYRWQIVQKPARSRAGIVDDISSVASLKPDLPGTYRVRLTVAPAGAENRGVALAPSPVPAPAAPSGPPTCLASLAAPSSGPTSAATSSAAASLQPLAQPTCVQPTGSQYPPPLPLAARRLTSTADVTVTATPTLGPMGLPIQTIAADGSIQVGPQSYPRSGSFAHLLELDQTTLQPPSQYGQPPTYPNGQAIEAARPGKLGTDVAGSSDLVDDNALVVISGMGLPHSKVHFDFKAAAAALSQAIVALHGSPPKEATLEAAVLSGKWSVIGKKVAASHPTVNLTGVTEASPPGGTAAASLPGSLNGYLQIVTTEAYTFVSPEFTSIDTKALGSSGTQSVFAIAGRTYRSSSIGSGTLGLHILVLRTDSPGGQPTPLKEGTFVLDNPYDATNQAGVKGAAEMLQTYRTTTVNDLIVMQTFQGDEVAPYTTPDGSKDWLNDAYIHPGNDGLYQWFKQPLLSAEPADLPGALDRLWNPSYPTVAGQVGDLTGQAGHDLVANFGQQDPATKQYPITRLTMVAANHVDPAVNYVRGSAGPQPGRLAGTLARSPQATWTVQQAAGDSKFDTSALRRVAFAPPTPWPSLPGDPTGARQQAALTYIAGQLFPGQGITDLRAQYHDKSSVVNWDTEAAQLKNSIHYKADQGFSPSDFDTLSAQLQTEMQDVEKVKNLTDAWKNVLSSGGLSVYAKLQAFTSRIIDQATKDAESVKSETSELNPLEIISESLYVAGDLAAFAAPEALPATLGVMAGIAGLSSLLMPADTTPARQGPDTTLIRDRADKLGVDLVTRLYNSGETISHLGQLFDSDWGKLQVAAANAYGVWAFGSDDRKVFTKSISITSARQIEQALLPLLYQQWVIAPYFTPHNPGGPQTPGTGYQCVYYDPEGHGPNDSLFRPYRAEPAGGLSATYYRPRRTPGSDQAPAQPYTVPYLIRALKSRSEPLELTRGVHAYEGYVSVRHSGANPPADILADLFAPVNPGEDTYNPSSLGMNKTEFYANFGGGVAEAKRMICAVGSQGGA